MAQRFDLPSGLHAQRVSAGRMGASRWEVTTRDGRYLGDAVHWHPEGCWDFQPLSGPVCECTDVVSVLETIAAYARLQEEAAS